MNDVIAKMELTGEEPGEASFTIVVEIGRPFLRGAEPEEWGCPVSVTPLYSKLHDAVGGDAFQALCLGAALVVDQLKAFQEKGGILRYKESHEEFPLEAYAFGSAHKKR